MNEHIKSFLITFFVGFSLVLVTEIDTITIESLSDGVLAGLIFAGVRGGIKMILELFLSQVGKK